MITTQTLVKDSNLDNLFRVIQVPIYNSLTNKNMDNIELINCIDLNMTNLKKYYPIISSILKKNKNYKKDLLYDLMEIRTISIHILNNLEQITTESFTELNPFLGKIYDNLLFIDILLDEFHQILKTKNEYINNKLSQQNYDIAYNRYKLKLEKNCDIFYEKYYDNTQQEEHIDVIKGIMSMEFIENEFK